MRKLRQCGINAYAVKKGPDSVDFGIKWLKGMTIIVDKHCINMQNELSVYHWKEDAGGNALPIPVDKDNHLIDELRYAYERAGISRHYVFLLLFASLMGSYINIPVARLPAEQLVVWISRGEVRPRDRRLPVCRAGDDEAVHRFHRPRS